MLKLTDIFTESRSANAQIHNVSCVLRVLVDDYLHTNLSHISASKFIQGDGTTVYNLLEILDGLLDFMLDHVNKSAAGM